MSDELYHHGIMGMHWGVRRFQNADGTLTPKGKKRYEKVYKSKKLSDEDTEYLKTAINTKKRRVGYNIDSVSGSIYSHENFLNKSKDPSYRYKGIDRDIKINREHLKWYKKRLKELTEEKESYDKLLKDIDSGKLRAGKDFIVQHDNHFLSIDERGDLRIFRKENRLIIGKNN